MSGADDGKLLIQYATDSDPKSLKKVLDQIKSPDAVNAKNNGGNTALIMAAMTSRERLGLEVVKMLLQAGAAVNLQNKQGQSALMIASAKGYPLIVEALLLASADFRLRNNEGKKAEALTKNEAVLTLLREAERAKQAAERAQQVERQGKRVLELIQARDIPALKQFTTDSKLWPESFEYVDTQASEKHPRPPLHIAAESLDIELIDILIVAGANADSIDTHGNYTPILRVVGQRRLPSFPNSRHSRERERLRLSVLQAFLLAGADLEHAETVNGFTPLLSAAYMGYEEDIRLLITAGSDVNVVDRNGATALAHACRRGHTGVVQLLLQAGAERNTIDDMVIVILREFSKYHRKLSSGHAISMFYEGGHTALMWASYGGHADAVMLIVEKDREIGEAYNKTRQEIEEAYLKANPSGRSASSSSSRRKSTAPKGGKGNKKETGKGKTAKVKGKGKGGGSDDEGSVASTGSRSQSAAPLQDIPPPFVGVLNQRARFGQTAVYWAVEKKHYDIAKFLIEAGADPKIGIDSGASPILLASKNNAPLDFVEFLIRVPVNVNQASGDRISPLLWAVWNRNMDIAKLLAFAGANPNYRDLHGRTVIQQARDIDMRMMLSQMAMHF